LGKEIVQLIYELNVIYYKPYSFLPALRIEIAAPVIANKNRLGALLEGIKLQCGSPSLQEPFPLYLADRMVKHLGFGLSAVRRTVTQEMVENTDLDVESLFLALHSFRTEGGR
jgi:hypothetical protein